MPPPPPPPPGKSPGQCVTIEGGMAVYVHAQGMGHGYSHELEPHHDMVTFPITTFAQPWKDLREPHAQIHADAWHELRSCRPPWSQ